MVKYSIKIFARLRPTKKSIGAYDIGEDHDSASTLSFTVPRTESSGLVNNKRELFLFRFNNVFDQSIKQDEIFEQVARPVIDNCLQGYNGTLFAYGQTGSGKTFTITGGAERYSDRGIIPRTLSYLFQQYQKVVGTVFTTEVSYLEIYNEYGFDLLDPKHEASKLEDLPRVSLFESSDGSIHLKNLSLHQTANEEEALNWLFLGDTNRMIAETPMNMASTRSHCIFTIYISSREVGSDTIRRAKLHLVDLAGSERVGKTGVGGTLLTEAKYINLSLHYLEQVIVALSEKSRSHIPYRNSMMTSVLRDSLGGNCMTSMIATLSVEKRNIEESISTCRFAQRVALIKNDAILNEELDPKLMVARLQQQVDDLKQELVMVTGEQRTDELTTEEKQQIESTVVKYVGEVNPDSQLLLGTDMRKIQLAYSILKRLILEIKTASINHEADPTSAVNNEEIIKLEDRLKQRDEEINVLLKMLKQERRRVAENEALLQEKGIKWSSPSNPLLGKTSPLNEKRSIMTTPTTISTPTTVSTPITVTTPTSSNDSRAAIRAELSQARQVAFDSFRHNIADTSVLNRHKETLKTKYGEAKALGEQVNTSRLLINQLKTKLEKVRISHRLLSSQEDRGDNYEEEELRIQLEKEKTQFKELCSRLKSLKTEIEHVQHLMEKAKVQLQQDFETWWSSHQKSSPVRTTPVLSQTIHTSNNEPLKLAKPVQPVSQTRYDVGTTLPLTGDSRADADIIAFYKARQKLINKGQQ